MKSQTCLDGLCGCSCVSAAAAPNADDADDDNADIPL